MPDFLPVAAVVAISLFVTKEVFEFVRRAAERKRKKRAIKALLRDEIQANHLALNHLLMALDMARATPFYKGATNAIVTGFGGRMFYRRFAGDGSVLSGAIIRNAKSSEYQRLLPQAAELDPKLYRLMRDGYTHVHDLENIITSFMDHAGGPPDEKEWFEPFQDWASSRMREISLELCRLHIQLGGKASDIKVPACLRCANAPTNSESA